MLRLSRLPIVRSHYALLLQQSILARQLASVSFSVLPFDLQSLFLGHHFLQEQHLLLQLLLVLLSQVSVRVSRCTTLSVAISFQSMTLINSHQVACRRATDCGNSVTINRCRASAFTSDRAFVG